MINPPYFVLPVKYRFLPICRYLQNNDFYSGWLMPRTATLISKDKSGAYYYLPRSVESFLSPQQLGIMARDNGFVRWSFHPMTLGVVTITKALAPA